MLLCLPDHDRVSFLQNLVYRDEGLERLDFVGEDRLSVGERQLAPYPPTLLLYRHVHFHTSPEGRRRLVIPCVNDTTADMFPWTNQRGCVRRIQDKGPIRLGAVSSIITVSALIHS